MFLAIAVVLGCASYLLVRGYAARVDALAPSVGPMVQVVVAERELFRGTALSSQMLRAEHVPSAYAAPGALHGVEGAVGHVLVSDLAAGELVTQTRLGPARAGPVASLVPGGMRAVDVPVSADPADVVPGDRVDVLATFGGGQPHTETPGVGLEVLAVAGGGGAGVIPASSETGGDGGPTVTLLVTPEEAESLAYASAFATLSISVLGPDDSGATFGTGG